MVMVCRPPSASDPPMTSITAATAPIRVPQKITVRRDGSVVPRSESDPITMEAASAPETKKMATSAITSTIAIVDHGSCSRVLNSWDSATPSPYTSVPFCCRSIAVAPKMANHTRLTTLGTSSTPVTN